MDIRQLMCFVEVAKQESFTKAAENLYLTQPAISKMIKSLEEELKVSLIERSTKRVKLTDMGQVILLQAQKIVESMHTMENEPNDVLQLRKGSIGLGIPSMYGGLYFSPVLSIFSRSFPQIDIHLAEGNSAQLLEKMGSGEIDLCVTDAVCNDESIESWKIFEEPLVLITSKDHPLARKSQVSFSETKKEKWIFFSEETGIFKILESYFPKESMKHCGFCQSSQWDFVVEMVSDGLGISLIPQSLYQRYLTGRVAGISIKENPSLSISLASKKQRYLSHAAKQWLEFSKNYFSQLK